jgi:hypothetical protein
VKRASMLVYAVLVVLLAAGCSKKMTEAWEVKEPRLLGARVEVDGDDTGRSRPRVGDTFQVRTFLAYKKPPAVFSFAASLCLSVKLPTGQTACVLELPVPDLDVDYTGGVSAVLRSAAFTVPEELVTASAALGDLAGASLFAAACADGTAERIPGTDATKDRFTDLFRCVDNADAEFPDPLLFTYGISFDFGEDGQLNHHPSFACTADVGACAEGVPGTDGAGVPGSIVIQQLKPAAERSEVALWPESPADASYPATDCAGIDGLTEARAGAEYAIRVRFDPEDREAYQRVTPLNDTTVTEDTREDLLLSHAFTSHGGGSLDSFSSLVDRATDDARAEAEITYKAPDQSNDPKKHVPDGGKLVTFFFIVRDGRGGVDYTTRALCLLPPLPTSD